MLNCFSRATAKGDEAMRKLLLVLAISAMTGASAATAFACPYHSASAKHNMSVAEAAAPSESNDVEAMTTFDPDKGTLDESSDKPE
jgi:hypothetical protein